MNAGDATSRPRFCFADVNDALPLSGSRLSVPDLRSPGPGFELRSIPPFSQVSRESEAPDVS